MQQNQHTQMTGSGSAVETAGPTDAPFMRQLLQLGVGQVVAHKVGHPVAVVVRLKAAPMQRHDLLQLLRGRIEASGS